MEKCGFLLLLLAFSIISFGVSLDVHGCPKPGHGAVLGPCLRRILRSGLEHWPRRRGIGIGRSAALALAALVIPRRSRIVIVSTL